MGLLVRSVAGLSLLFLMLPLDLSKETGIEEQAGPLQSLFTARDALGDLQSLCQTQPELCANAQAAIAAIIENAALLQSSGGNPTLQQEIPHPTPRAPLAEKDRKPAE
ncbi:DUF5330 domain-containing protein [Chelativorans sp. J32]|uniref:DUF5330 domain-containing protein n=1 Tax=Chelativorans sp. J32 TaxID=935840 RepID=UPI0004B5E237|nr:DUF5330 domain-containing protein [Chelativorans sp. J32]